MGQRYRIAKETPRELASQQSQPTLKRNLQADQEQLYSEKQFLSPSQIVKKNKYMTAQQSLVGLRGKPLVIDDNSINDHIRRIMTQRSAISELAQKYGLEDNQKVERLSLLSVPNQLGQYRNGPD